jgi:hypothetical protein
MPRVSGTDDAMAYPTGQLCLSLELRRAVHARLVERPQPCYHSRRSLSELVGWSSVGGNRPEGGAHFGKATRPRESGAQASESGAYFPLFAELIDLHKSS